jgi:hypothetical protein
MRLCVDIFLRALTMGSMRLDFFGTGNAAVCADDMSYNIRIFGMFRNIGMVSKTGNNRQNNRGNNRPITGGVTGQITGHENRAFRHQVFDAAMKSDVRHRERIFSHAKGW